MRPIGNIGVVLSLVCGAGLSAFSQAAPVRPSDDQTRIAVIQFQPAITATNEFQRDFAVLEKKFDPKRTELKNMNDEIDRLTKELQAESTKLSEPQQEERARAIENKKKQAQRTMEDTQNDYNEQLQDLLGRIGQKLGEVLTTYAKDHSFTLVVDRSEQQDETPVVLWASSSTDITQPVVDAYNAKSGVPAQAAVLPSAPPPSAQR